MVYCTMCHTDKAFRERPGKNGFLSFSKNALKVRLGRGKRIFSIPNLCRCLFGFDVHRQGSIGPSRLRAWQQSPRVWTLLIIKALSVCKTPPSPSCATHRTTITTMKPHIPSSSVGWILCVALILFLLLVLLLLLLFYRQGKMGRCCRRLCRRNSPIIDEATVQEYSNMDDLLLEVDDHEPSRLGDQVWTADSLMPNILKARSHKKRGNNSDNLTTPLL